MYLPKLNSWLQIELSIWRPPSSTVFAIAIWLGLGLLDFATGFVQFSLFRLFLLFALLPLLFPLTFFASVERFIGILQQRRLLRALFLLLLVILGFALFVSRQVRGANMADDAIFVKVIEYTYQGCLLCTSNPLGSYFRAHNNLFLVLFAPLVVLPGWWFIAHLIQSVAIVAWCRTCGWALGGGSSTGWLATAALFLATYTQHATFYDTRFAALALAVFAVGFYLSRTRLMLVGALAAVVTRETAAITVALLGSVGISLKKTCV